jgi:nucleoside-diphosphate-sugar epimerase
LRERESSWSFARRRREIGIDTATGRELIAIDPRYFRPTEVELLLGDATKAKTRLGWTPAVSFTELIEMMVDADLAAVQSGIPFTVESSSSTLQAFVEVSAGQAQRCFVAGHRGLVGSAIVRALDAAGYPAPVVRTRDELDLLDQSAVKNFFASEKPEIVFLAAAKVGGIGANNAQRWDFSYQNLMLEGNVLGAAVESALRNSSSSGARAFTRECPAANQRGIPADRTARADERALRNREDCRPQARRSGEPEPRKKMAVSNADQSLRAERQLRSRDVARAPALIRKFHEAKEARDAGRDATVTSGEQGNVRREFLHVDDASARSNSADGKQRYGTVQRRLRG